MTGDIVAGLLVAGLLHTFNLVLGVFAPTIHALRLHYVEFFSKFLEVGGGVLPLSMRSISIERSLIMEKAYLAFAAALAIGLPALATAWAQSRIGAAGAGTLAEKPELTGTIIVLIAIPETMVILGFVVAAMILLMI